MNVSDLELFKKSKIIKIGSVKKKLRLPKVGGFWKKSGNPEIFVPGIWEFGSETVRPVKISRISKFTTIFCYTNACRHCYFGINLRCIHSKLVSSNIDNLFVYKRNKAIALRIRKTCATYF